jgi:hypothetical protein
VSRSLTQIILGNRGAIEKRGNRGVIEMGQQRGKICSVAFSANVTLAVASTSKYYYKLFVIAIISSCLSAGG